MSHKSRLDSLKKKERQQQNNRQSSSESQNPSLNSQTESVSDQNIDAKSSEQSVDLEALDNFSEEDQPTRVQESSNFSFHTEELEKLKQDNDYWKSTSQRMGAELQNMQKQHDLDTLQVQKKAKKNVALILLDFLNTMYLAFNFAPKTEDQQVIRFIETLKTSFDKLVLDLKNMNIEVLMADPGSDFNPEFMSVLNGDELNSDETPTIRQVVTLGLRVDNQVVQPAAVLLNQSN